MKTGRVTLTQVKARRQAIFQKQEKLRKQMEKLSGELLSIQAVCPHPNISSYVNYEDSGWFCPDCCGDWNTHPDKKSNRR